MVQVRQLLLLLALSFLAACAEQGALDRTRLDGSIINGESVNWSDPITQSTVMIAKDIVYQKEVPQFFGICSGVIVDFKFILTAAHCVNSPQIKYKVVHNPNPRQSSKIEIFNVKKVHLHPTFDFGAQFGQYSQSRAQLKKFEDYTSYYDIALLELERPLKVLRPSSIISDMFLTQEKSTTAFIAGYGRTVTGDASTPFTQVNGQLKKASVQLISRSESNSHIVTEQRSNTAGVCVGDSGGPLFTMNSEGQLRLKGIAVAVFDNTVDRIDIENLSPIAAGKSMRTCEGYGLFVNINMIEKWLKKTIAEESDNNP